MKVNLNDTVRVKLTDYGRKLYQERIEKLYREIGAKHEVHRQKKEDAEGWSEWQLWVLMNEFGKYFGAGFHEQPFETEIEIPAHDISNGEWAKRVAADKAKRTEDSHAITKDEWQGMSLDAQWNYVCTLERLRDERDDGDPAELQDAEICAWEFDSPPPKATVKTCPSSGIKHGSGTIEGKWDPEDMVLNVTVPAKEASTTIKLTEEQRRALQPMFVAVHGTPEVPEDMTFHYPCVEEGIA